MVVELNLLLVITIIMFSLIGIFATIYYLIDHGLVWGIKHLITKIKKIPIIRTKKLRFEIGMITGWIRNKNAVRRGVKTFYAWGRIGKIIENYETYDRLRYLAAFSMGKPLESQLKENNRYREKYKVKMNNTIKEF